MQIGFELQGKFRFEVFNRDGSLSHSIEETPNFITPSGLSYIKEFALADCFRYVSVGTGTGASTLLGGGTTGLQFPISGLQYIGGNPLGCGRGNQYIGDACGYRVDLTGLSLFRGWKLPAGTGVYFDNNYTLNEFMVTPGPTRTWGYRYGGASGACNCSEVVFADPSEVGETRTGIEARDFHSYYPQVCDADKAFARVLRRIQVTSGQFLIAHYSLYVNLQSGVRRFGFTGGQLSPYNSESQGVYNWSGISGLYSLLHYGFKPINDGGVTSVSFGAQQINNLYQFRMGESYIPIFGIPLEPSCPTSNRMGYLTDDAIQFFANPSGGPMSDTGIYFPFNIQGRPFPSGVFYFEPRLISEFADDTYQNIEHYDYRNARRSSSPILRPHTGNFLSSNTYAFQEILSTDIIKSGVVLVDSGRSRSLSLIFKFDDENSTVNKAVRSHVQAYKHSSSNTTLFPYLDMLFYPQTTGGKFNVSPVPDANTTSGITFLNLLTPTGVNDYPPLSVDVQSPYNSSIPTSEGNTYWLRYPTNTFNSGNLEMTRMGYLFTFDDRVNKKIVLNHGVDTQAEFAGVRSVYEANKINFFCYVTPIYNSGFISNLIWTGLSFPTEAIELSGVIEDLTFPYNSELELVNSQFTWPSIRTFVARDVTYPSWLLTGQNCVFCSGRFIGINSGLYLARTVVEKNYNIPFFGLTVEGFVDNPYTYFVTSNTRYSGIVSATFTPSYLTSYKLPSGALISGSASGGYSYMDWNNQLTMKFYLNWSSPCPSGVVGC